MIELAAAIVLLTVGAVLLVLAALAFMAWLTAPWYDTPPWWGPLLTLVVGALAVAGGVEVLR